MPQKQQLFKKIALLTMAATTGMSTFQQIAVAVSLDNFTEANWNQFVSTTKEAERANQQELISNRHSNHTQHSNSTWHSNADNHVNTTSHSQSSPHNNSHTDTASHTQGQFPYSLPGHTNTHGQGWTHTNNNVNSGRHWNTHQNTPTHVQGIAHGNRHTQTDTHANHTRHSNSFPHSNSGGHSDANPHANNPLQHGNSGFHHDNYIPSRPTFFDLQENKQLFGVAVLGVYSYDKNTDGFGSQEAISRITHYDLSIRRIQNLNGTSNISTWRTLLADAVELSGGGIRFNLNTIDPLGTGNTNPAITEGIYEIHTNARNASQHGVAFESAASTIRVRIQQNHIPEITVQNGSEFINFTFGFNGALNPANIYRTYQEGLFANAPAHQQEGIFVRVSMRDRDTTAQTVQNWQRGRIFLSNSSNVEIAGTSVPIVWENGLQIISSENIAREGIGFIPRNSFTGLGDLVGARVTVEVSDFRNAEATIPTGTTVTQRTISTTDTTTLTVNVDVTAPTVTATPTTTTWRNTPPSVTLDYTDALSGIHTREFAITDSVTTPTIGWLPYTAPVAINTDGERFLHFRGTDRLRNVRTGVFGPYRLDRVAPTGSIAEAILGANEVRLTATATDALSGISEIRATGPAGSGGPWVSTTSPLIFTATREGNYTFTIRDNAGNIRTITHNVIFVPILHGLSLTHIVRPPAGTVAPINYPVAQPTRVNSGFRMTFRVNAQRASSVELRLFANGVPVNIHTDAGQSQFLTRNTTTLENTFVEFAFWVDRNIPLNTVLDMRLILRRDGHVITNNDIGRRFAIISGSARQSIGINLTR